MTGYPQMRLFSVAAVLVILDTGARTIVGRSN